MEAIMGLLDSLGGVLKGAMGEAEAAALPALVNAVLAKTEYHDLNGLVAALQQGGASTRKSNPGSATGPIFQSAESS
jgi:hypothetical protein